MSTPQDPRERLQKSIIELLGENRTREIEEAEAEARKKPTLMQRLRDWMAA